MRFLVLVLVLMVATKLGTQRYIADSAKSEITISAYRDLATSACRDAARSGRLVSGAGPVAAEEVRLVIGKAGIDVALWQVDHALWPARFKNPYLHFTLSDGPRRLHCEFDVVQRAASVLRM